MKVNRVNAFFEIIGAHGECGRQDVDIAGKTEKSDGYCSTKRPSSDKNW